MTYLSCCWVSVALLTLVSPGFSSSKHSRSWAMRRWEEFPSDPDQDRWFTQNLDHFDPSNTNIWKQRYNEDQSFFNRSNDSPIFLFVNGEAPMFNAAGMAWYEYAEEFNAFCFQLEHRFYGSSQPTGDLSVQSLRYLSSEQALADIAYFIDGMNHKHNLTDRNKWVLFGGSYSGNLVAWARLKYPHLVHAAVSSSGPVLALANFRGYYRVVQDALAAHSKGCCNDVHKAFLNLEAVLKKPDASEVISKKFNICSKLDLSKKWDVTTMFERLVDLFDAQDPGNEIEMACSIMTDNRRDLISRLGALDKAQNFGDCSDFSFQDFLEAVNSTSVTSSGASSRSWLYQTCTEFGYFQTSVSPNDIFGSSIPLQYYVELCKNLFGPDFDEDLVNDAVKRTNIMYGGKNIVNHATNVVFVQGGLDPWHVLGVCNSSNPGAPAILIEGMFHCSNMDPSLPIDPPQLVEARKKIVHYLGIFLSG